MDEYKEAQIIKAFETIADEMKKQTAIMQQMLGQMKKQ